MEQKARVIEGCFERVDIVEEKNSITIGVEKS